MARAYSEADLAHWACKWFRANLNHHVDVIPHPAVRVKTCAKVFDVACDDDVEKGSIAFGEEDRLLVIATQGDVVETAGQMNS